jgi:hypothetical protein
MKKLCDDCFEDFETTIDEDVCPKCRKLSKTIKYKDGDVTGDIWKVVRSTGFKSDAQLKEYQIVKKDHKVLTGFELPKVEGDMK